MWALCVVVEAYEEHYGVWILSELASVMFTLLTYKYYAVMGLIVMHSSHSDSIRFVSQLRY